MTSDRKQKDKQDDHFVEIKNIQVNQNLEKCLNFLLILAKKWLSLWTCLSNKKHPPAKMTL